MVEIEDATGAAVGPVGEVGTKRRRDKNGCVMFRTPSVHQAVCRPSGGLQHASRWHLAPGWAEGATDGFPIQAKGSHSTTNRGQRGGGSGPNSSPPDSIQSFVRVFASRQAFRGLLDAPEPCFFPLIDPIPIPVSPARLTRVEFSMHTTSYLRDRQRHPQRAPTCDSHSEGANNSLLRVLCRFPFHDALPSLRLRYGQLSSFFIGSFDENIPSLF